MSDPEVTLPPRQPNTPRVWLIRAWALAREYPDVALPIVALLGIILGAVFL